MLTFKKIQLHIIFIVYVNVVTVQGYNEFNNNINRTTWDKEDFPNPQRDFESCGRGGKKSWVCDPQKIISELTSNIIDQIIDSTRRETKCVCENCEGQNGYKISVAIVPDISVNGRSISDDRNIQQKSATKEFGSYLRTKSWKFGQCDNDVVLVLAKSEAIIQFSIGMKAAKKLSDKCVRDIMNENTGRIIRGSYGLAIKNIMAQLRTVFKGSHTCTDNGFRWYYVVGPIIVVAALILYVLTAMCRNGGCTDEDRCNLLCSGICLGLCICRD